MAALGNYCYRELTAVGVKVVKPTGGYYAMPDFEVIDKLSVCSVNLDS
jgi:hypothetical protein